jgi:hypothetical protein
MLYRIILSTVSVFGCLWRYPQVNDISPLWLLQECCNDRKLVALFIRFGQTLGDCHCHYTRLEQGRVALQFDFVEFGFFNTLLATVGAST